MEGLKVSDVDMVVYIHPSKQKKVSEAILHEMSSLLFKFNETFDGVVLAYDLNVASKSARILSSLHPYFGVKIRAKLLLFAPKPNMLLEGKVVKLTQESIHVIVLGFSSAIIIADDIHEEFKFKIKHGNEVFVRRAHKQHVIKVGTMIRFMMKSMDEEILYISGSLTSTNTGSIKWLDKHFEDGSLAHRWSKKREAGERQVHDADGGAPSMNDHQEKKLKKCKIGSSS